jgi:hypothetical protein
MKHRTYLVLLFTVLLIVPVTLFSQKAYKVQKKRGNSHEAYPNPFDFHPTGWLFDAGLTGTMGLDGTQTTTFGDTTLTLSTQFRPGISFSAGRYLSLKKGHKIFKYLDYNLGYKMLWNLENQEREITSSGAQESFTNSNIAHYANANLNFNNIISLSDYSFIQNSIGVNVDYRFLNNASATGTNANIQPANFIVQVHYKLAFGFMFDNDKAIIPYIEIPVYNITPQQSNFSQLDYFNQSFQSITVGARFMLFTLGQKKCPTAKGTTVDPNQNNGY